MSNTSIKSIYDKFLTSSGVSTDTRKIAEDCIFFALKGPNFDGNTYANDAIKKGAAYAVVDNETYCTSSRHILVDDSLVCLQNLANYHRQKLDIPFIGITGSNGKTTSKELINAVLSTQYNTYATKGNLNNHIGVPLTILSINDNIEIAIIEMGASKLGDIIELCEIALPTHGIITNIGKAHVEGFGSLENILRGKSELYHHLIQHKGQVFINSKDPVLKNMGRRFTSPLYYSSKGDFFSCEFLGADPYVSYKDEGGDVVHTKLIGEYNFDNINSALCIAKYFKIPGHIANKAIIDYTPSNNRSQVIKTKSNTIILDAYNANPNSMEAAINNLLEMKSKKKAVILGDMFELGNESQIEHEKVGSLLNNKKLDFIFLCGENMKYAHVKSENSKHFDHIESIKKHFEQFKPKDTTILIKGSRGMAMENIIENI